MRPGYLDGGQADRCATSCPNSHRRWKPSPISYSTHACAPARLQWPDKPRDATISFIGEGVDPEAERQVSSSTIDAGSNLSSGDRNGIMLGRGLAENLGVKVGERVVLLANTSSGGINAVERTVRGLFSTVSKAYDNSALRVPLPLAQKLLRVSGQSTAGFSCSTKPATRIRRLSRYETIP